MVDLSDIKAPGWQRAVAELSAAAPDDGTYLVKLLAVLVQVAGARQGALFTLVGQREDDQASIEARPEMVWPMGAGDAGAPAAVDPKLIERFTDARAAAQASGTTRQARVYGLEDGGDQFYDGGAAKSYLLAVPIAGGLPNESASIPVRGVVTLLLDARSRQALQTTLALVEVLAGYVFTHAAQQALRRTRQAGASLDLATRLIAAANATTGFKACVFQLVNDLCRQLGVDRVALGWVAGSEKPGGRRFVKTVAVSDTENIDRRMVMIQKLEAAMDECMDQEQAVVYPPPNDAGADADAVLSRAVVHAHRDLAAGDARLKVASLPLRVSDKEGDRVIGVVTVEAGSAGDRAGGHVDLGTIELLQAALDLAAPVLRVRHSDDRNLALRAKDSTLRQAAWLVGPTHTGWKLGGIATLIGSLVVTFVRIPYRVGAPMELRPREVRTISAPFDGVLWTLSPGVEHGKVVHEGELLAELDTTQLKLGLVEAQNQRLQYEKEADEAMNKRDQAEAQQALAKVRQAESRIGLLQQRIEQARIVSPISGTIISGDVKDKVKASIKLGDAIFQVADLSRMLAVAKVEDRDIAMIAVGQTGEISPKSDPALKIPVVVERVVPLAQAAEGRNNFEVHASLEPGSGGGYGGGSGGGSGGVPGGGGGSGGGRGLLPGVEGQARFNAERHSLAWIATRRVIDQLRMWLWW